MVAHLVPGNGFGELALLDDNKPLRNASIVAKSALNELLKLKKDDYRKIVSVAQQQDFRWKIDFLTKVDLFKGWTNTSLYRVCGIMHDRLHEAGEVVIKQGEVPQDMFFVLDGELDVIKEEIKVKKNKHPTSTNSWKETRIMARTNYVVTTLHKGQFFGETAIISDSTRTATIVAKTYTHLLALNKRNFLELMVGRADKVLEDSDEFDVSGDEDSHFQRKGYPSEECVLALFSTIQARENMNFRLANSKKQKNGEIERAKHLWRTIGSTPTQRLMHNDCETVVRNILHSKTPDIKKMRLMVKKHENSSNGIVSPIKMPEKNKKSSRKRKKLTILTTSKSAKALAARQGQVQTDSQSVVCSFCEDEGHVAKYCEKIFCDKMDADNRTNKEQLSLPDISKLLLTGQSVSSGAKKEKARLKSLNLSMAAANNILDRRGPLRQSNPSLSLPEITNKELGT